MIEIMRAKATRKQIGNVTPREENKTVLVGQTASPCAVVTLRDWNTDPDRLLLEVSNDKRCEL